MSYQFNLSTNITFKVDNCNLKNITGIFFKALNELFLIFVTSVLLHYFEQYYNAGELAKMLGVRSVAKKTNMTTTKFKTFCYHFHQLNSQE